MNNDRYEGLKTLGVAVFTVGGLYLTYYLVTRHLALTFLVIAPVGVLLEVLWVIWMEHFHKAN